MIIVGVDYSTKAIDLAFKGDDFWNNRRLIIGKDGIDKKFLETLRGELGAFTYAVKAVYIEKPWMNVGFGNSNPKTTMQMVAVATIVQMTGIMLGYRIEWAPVVSWRSKVFGKGKYTKAIAKGLAISWAQANTGLTIPNDNVADACCIAQYGAMMESENAQ